MELQILHSLQAIHTPLLDKVMVFFTTLGNSGGVWIATVLLMILFRKTRRCGVIALIAMALTFLIDDLVIKKLVARQRPFTVDPSVQLLIKAPKDYSFPSGHTANGFAPAIIIFLEFRRKGIIALVLAAVIAFSRLYLFVHFPTDVLGGLILAICDASLVYFIYTKYFKEKERADNGEKVLSEN